MAAYLQKAALANGLLNQVLDGLPKGSPEYIECAIAIAKIYNLGIRSNPRPCMGTVRLRAVQSLLEGTGIDARMTKIKDSRTGREFNALSLIPPTDSVIHADESDDE